MSLHLTSDAVNEFYDVIHGIEHSLDHIHHSLEAIVDGLGDVSTRLELISNHIADLDRPKEV